MIFMKNFFAMAAFAAAMVFATSGCSAVFDSLRNGVSKIANGDVSGYKNIVTLSGDTVTEAVAPSDGKEITSVVLDGAAFNAVNNGTAFIKIIPSIENKAELKYQSDITDYGFSASAANGEFKITANEGTQFRTACFEVTVYANCNSININGGIELIMDGVSADSLEITVQGAVKAQVADVHADSINIIVDGAGEFDINGNVESLSTEFNGAGELRAMELICKDASITINGAGEAEISCTDTLSTSINGAGSVSYYGSPKVLKGNSGAASVTQKSVNVYGK